jgi:hypothetical protein
MADVSVTAASCVKGTTAQSPTNAQPLTKTLNAAVSITAGQTVYEDTSVSPAVLRLADANGTAAASVVGGVALNGAAAGQPVTYQYQGAITIGGTLVAGTLYAQSETAGSICPINDLVSGDFPCIVGWASSTSLLQLVLASTSTALPADIA